MTETRNGSAGIFGKAEIFDPRSAGEFDVFVREAEELVKRRPEPSLEDFDDSCWRNFVKQTEIDSAVAGLPESDAMTAPPRRLRRERQQPEDLFKCAGGRADRTKAVLRQALREPIVNGELSESTAQAIRELLLAAPAEFSIEATTSIVDGLRR